jgi:molecular chaperone HtpG
VQQHRFQINLRGIISLLSDHLYSKPEVFVRELLQNCVDAITARQQIDKSHVGDITLSVTHSKGKSPTLEITDNGIGLTPDEVHRFLATIGESSKRDEAGRRTGDFLGQFGIGLLSCFIVSNEIVVLTRSAKGGPVVEWRGKSDGTYSLRELDIEIEPGTQVFLTCREDREDLFALDRLRELALYYGGLLPYPIRVSSGKSSTIVNEKGAPWRLTYRGEKDRRNALLKYGQATFGETFLDVIPIQSSAGGIDGLAFVLPHPANLTAKQTHRVYLRNMFLGESAEQLLPEWAVFVRGVLNVQNLRPTASRESFYEDERLEATRVEIGECLRAYLLQLAQKEPNRFERFLSVHHLALKALAVQDDECFRMFAEWLPFETSQGRLTIGALRESGDVIRYVDDVGQFHQMSKLAAAQGFTLVNAGYVYESELLSRLPEIDPDIRVERTEPSSMAQDFEELSLAEQDQSHDLLAAAADVLKPFRSVADVRKYLPDDVPVLFVLGNEGRFFRSLEQAKEVADPLFAGVLGNIGAGRGGDSNAQVVFNYSNSLIRDLTQVKDRNVLKRSVEVLYVQSLLLAQQPLTTKELSLMNQGLAGMVAAIVKQNGGKKP